MPGLGVTEVIIKGAKENGVCPWLSPEGIKGGDVPSGVI
jgi:hypothetical protein